MNYADLFNTIFAKDHLVQELGYFLLMSHPVFVAEQC